MTGKTPPKPFDITTALKPPTALLPGIGTVSLRVRTVSFLQWFAKGDKAGRWADGLAFVRALLLERVAPPEPEEGEDIAGLPLNLVDTLSAAELETIAGELIDKAAPIFASLRPRKDAEAPESSGEDDFETQDPPDGIPASDRLLAGARAYRADYDASQEGMMARLAEAGGATSLARHLPMLNPLSDIQSALGVQKMSYLAQQVELASRGFLGSSPFRDVDALRELLPRMRAANAIADLTSGLKVASMDRGLWTSANKMLDLGLSKAVLDAVLGIREAPDLVSEIELKVAAMLRPGYQSIASLALNGTIAQGAASDLLRVYGAPPTDAPIFASVLDAVAALDDPEATESQRLALLHRLIGLFSRTANWVHGEIDLAALLALVAAVASVLALYPELVPFRKDPKPSPEMIEAVNEIKGLRSDMKAARDAGSRTQIRYVHGKANLRAEPEGGGLLLRIVYPDQWVEIRDTRGDWARVAVYDYASDAPIEGWMSRRTLHVDPD